MNCLATLWTFETARFRVTCEALEEPDLDLSWDETGEVAEKLVSGEYVAFCACVRVTVDGRTIGTDYLGGCIYRDGDEFVTSHRDPDPMNRNCSLMRAARGDVSICHYFPGMVSEAIAEARATVCNMPRMRCAA